MEWFFIAAGIFSICGALFNWDWFLNNWRARFFVRVLGRGGARIFYGLLGVGLAGGGISMLIDSEGPAEPLDAAAGPASASRFAAAPAGPEFCGKTWAFDSVVISCHDPSFTSGKRIPELTSLRKLDLSHSGILDVTPLAKFSELRELNLSHTKVVTLAPIAKLVNLRGLSLNGTGIVNLEAISRFTQLQSLSIGYTGVTDLAPLASLTELQLLDLGGTKVTTIGATRQPYQAATL